MPDNRDIYFERMTNNFSNGTKALLPMFLKGKRILDVGVGSGTLGKELREIHGDSIILDGVDMRLDIEKEGSGYDNLIEADFCNMLKAENRYDTVYFSSVMHEIGSYAKEGQGMDTPIIRALRSTNNLLADEGIIVIRDGLAEERKARDTLLRATPASDEIRNALRRFVKEFRVYDKNFTDWSPLWDTGTSDTVTLPRWALKEFMVTYTWGPDSWGREIRERFCYLSASEWRKALNDTGFDVTFEIHSPENYEKFCGNFFENIINTATKEKITAFPDITITIVARKAKHGKSNIN